MYRFGKQWKKAAENFYIEEGNLHTVLKIDFVIPPIKGPQNFVIPS